MRSTARQAGRITLLIAMLITSIPLVSRMATATTVDEFTWYEVSASSPTAREGSALGHLLHDGTTVLFGGRTPSGAYLSDTRVLDASGTWQELAVSGPPARAYSANAYAGDLVGTLGGQRDYDSLVVFGGSSPSGLLGDTWSFDGSTWTKYLGTATPSPRSGSQMAYDPGAERIIMFGGNLGGGTLSAETWAFNGNTWGDRTTQISGPAPSARRQAAMAFSPALGKIVLHGGFDSAGTALSDTWAFEVDTNTWTDLTSTAGTPGAHGFHRMVTDTALGRIVMLAGDETWQFDGSTWSPATLSPSSLALSARHVHSMTYDAANDVILSVGGRTDPTTHTTASAGTLGLTITAVTEPAAPAITSVASVADGTGVNIEWVAPSDGGAELEGYDLRVLLAADDSEVATATPGASDVTASIPGLTPGTTYVVELSARNRVGSSPTTTSGDVTTNDVAEAPRDVLATAGADNGQITVTWTTPGNDGGTPVTGYEIVRMPGTTVVGSTAAAVRQLTISGLGNGTDDTFAVRALNAVGTSPLSTQSSARTFDIPGIVEGFTGNAGPDANQVTLSWNPPVADGGAPVLGYYLSRNGNDRLAQLVLDASTPADPANSPDDLYIVLDDANAPSVVWDVVDGTDFYQVRAYNQVGRGPLSDSLTVDPFAAPEAIVDLAVAATDVGELTLSWSAPASDMPITGYEITRQRGSQAPSAPFTVASPGYVDTGLVRGSLYTYTVAAISDAGTGEAATAARRTWNVPSTVRNLAATSGVGQVRLDWNPPSNDNGSAVTEYRIQRNGLDAATVPAGTTTWTDSGLLAGVSNTYRVAAVNAVGNSGWRSTVGESFDVPDAPVLVAIYDVGVGALDIGVAPGSEDGGTPVTEFRLYRQGVATPVDTFAWDGSSRFRLHDRNLDDGTTYVYTVTAVNAAGESASSNSGSGRTWALPGVPTDVAAATGPAAGELTVTWAAPSTGETRTPVTGYAISRDGVPLTTVAADQLSLVDSGLAAGSLHTYTVAAINAVGTGPGASDSATTFDTPAAPVIDAVAGPGAGEATVSWDAPADGGLPITGYQVLVDGSVADTTGPAARSLTLSGLGDARDLFVQVRAVNDAGDGDLSERADVRTFGLPTAPLDVVANPTPGHAGWITVTWSDPGDFGGTEDLTHFTVYAHQGGEVVRWVTRDADSPNRNRFTLTNLGTSQTYDFRVSASNLVGEGPLSLAVPAATATTWAAPDAPQIISAANSDTQAGVQILSWSAPADDGGLPISHYVVSFDDGTRQLEAIVDHDDSTDVFAKGWGSIAPGAEVRWTVAAVNDAGTSPGSVADETMFDLPDAPTWVWTAGGKLKVTGEWAAPTTGELRTPITGYKIVATGDLGTSHSVHVPAGQPLSGELSALKGETITATVTAFNLMGEGPGATASARAFTDPSAPERVMASNVADSTDVELTWTGSTFDGGTPLKHYRVIRNDMNTGWILLNLVGPDTTSYTDTTAGVGVTSQYAVVAVNQADYTSSRAKSNENTSYGNPGRPVAAAEQVSAEVVTITWTPPTSGEDRTPITGYTVLRDGATIGTTDAATLTFDDTSFADGTSHTYEVVAHNVAAPTVVEANTSAPVDLLTWDVPGMPVIHTGLTSPGVGQVTLTWGAPVDGEDRIPVTHYRVCVGTEDPTCELIAVDDLTTVQRGEDSYFTHTIDGLPKGSAFTFTIAAVNAVGDSAPAEITKRTWDTLDAPSRFRGGAGPDAGEITVRWRPPVTGELRPGTEATSYSLYRVLGDGSSLELLTTVPAVEGETQTTNYRYVHTGLGLAETVTYTVLATNAVGDGELAAPITRRTFDLPGAPINVAADNFKVTGSDFETVGIVHTKVTWMRSSYTGGNTPFEFDVIRNGEVIASVAKVAGNDRTHSYEYLDSTPGNGAEVQYSVVARNKAGDSQPGVSGAFTTWDVADAPGLVTAANAGVRSVEVTWVAPASDGGRRVTGYRVLRDGQPIAFDADGNTVITPEDADSDSDGVFSIVDGAGLTNGTAYEYQVIAVNRVGPSAPSDVAEVVTWDVPDAPTAVSAVNTGVREITVSWEAPEFTGHPTDGLAIRRYVIRRTETTTDGSTLTRALSHPVRKGTSFVDDGTSRLGEVLDGATYTYSVQAVNVVGRSELSETATVTTWDRPGAPTDLTAETVAATTEDGADVELTWTAPTFTGHATDDLEILEYRIYRDDELIASTAETTWLDTGLELGTTYRYVVTAVNVVGESLGVADTVTTWDVPGMPLNVVARSNGNVGEIEVTWEAPADDGDRPVTMYTIHRDGVEIGAVDGETFTFTDPDAGPIGYHEYHLVAHNSVGASDPSYQGCARAYPADTYSPLTICRRALPFVGRI